MWQQVKLQNAMEYLTTYAWALLIIAIVIAALFFLGLLNPTSSVSQECVFPSTFSCLNYQLLSNGSLIVNIRQISLDTLTINSLGCSSNSTSSNPSIPSNTITLLSDKNFTYELNCYTTSGKVFAGAIGSAFGGILQINYTDTQTDFPSSIVGKIVVKVAK